MPALHARPCRLQRGALVSAALAHAGVLLIDKGLLGDTMRNGKLVPVLAEYQPIGSLPVYIVYSERDLMPAKTKALVDFLLEEMPNLLQGE